MPGKAARSSLRDLTREFQSIAERLKKSVSSGPSGGSSKAEERQSGFALQSEFNRRASKIGLGIRRTSQRLAKLAELAKITSVFDDPTMEIQELAAVIEQDIHALNSAVVDLELLRNSRNEGGVSSDAARHSAIVVDDLKYRLMSAAKEYMEVLTMQLEKLEVLENRRRLFSFTAARTAAHASAAPPPPWANGGSPSSSSSSSSSPLFPSRNCLSRSTTVFEFLQQWGGMAVDRFRTLCERRW